MLIIERKLGASVRIGRHVLVRVKSIKGRNSVKLEIRAPREVPIVREELAPHDRTADGERKLRVLVIEDDEAHAELIELALEECEVDTIYLAADAGEGLELLREAAADPETAVDLVLLDLNLPDRDGERVVEAIRADEATATLPVIALSSCRDETRVDACLRAGANAFLEKGAGYDDVVETVRRVTGLFARARPAAG